MAGEEKTIRLIIDKADQLRVANSSACTEDSRSTEVMLIRGIPWKMYAHIDNKSINDESRWLNVFLVCCWEIETSWIISISTVIRAVRDTLKREKRVDISLRNTSPTACFSEFLQWKDVVLSPFVNDKKELILEIDLRITAIDTLIRDPYDFRGPGNQEDFQIFLDGSVFHVNAKILAVQAKYFKKMVKRGENQVIIGNDKKKISYHDLEAFLQLVHGNTVVINSINIFNLLLISQTFKCTNAEQLCAQFLVRSKYINLAEKIIIAKTFQLKSVKKVLIRSINHQVDFDRLFAETIFSDPREKIALEMQFDKLIKKKKNWNKKPIGDKCVREVIECQLDSAAEDVHQRCRWKEVWVHGIPFLFGIELLSLGNAGVRYFRITLECVLDKYLDWYLDITTVIQFKCHGEIDNSELIKTTRSLTQFQPKFELHIPNEQPTKVIRLLLKGEFALRKFKSSIFPNKFKYFKAPGTFTNVTLKVGGAKFYVVKEILATESPYFHVLFYHSFIESEKSKIRLEGIDPFEFEELLYCIHYPQRPITHDSVEFLLKLADYLDFQSILLKCDWYLMNTREFLPYQKNYLAVKYRLENTLIPSNVDIQDLTLHCGISDRMQNMITHIVMADHRHKVLQLQ